MRAAFIRLTMMTEKRKRLQKNQGDAVRVTDVARLAGCSTATVSRVQNTPDLVSAETRERVQAAIRALSYMPNSAARALRSHRSRMIGIVIPTLNHAIYASLVDAAQQRLASEDILFLSPLSTTTSIVRKNRPPCWSSVARRSSCLSEDPITRISIQCSRRPTYPTSIHTYSGQTGRTLALAWTIGMPLSKSLTSYMASDTALSALSALSWRATTARQRASEYMRSTWPQRDQDRSGSHRRAALQHPKWSRRAAYIAGAQSAPDGDHMRQ